MKSRVPAAAAVSAVTLLQRLEDMKKDAAHSYTSVELPQLSSSFRLPKKHNEFPNDEWRVATRQLLSDRFSPLIKSFPQLSAVFNETDWPLVACIHPSHLPKGPLRTTFAMPQELAMPGASFLQLSAQVLKFECQVADAMTIEDLLLPWMRASGIEHRVLYRSAFFPPTKESQPNTVPDDVLVPCAISLMGVILRGGGQSAAAAFGDALLMKSNACDTKMQSRRPKR